MIYIYYVHIDNKMIKDINYVYNLNQSWILISLN